MFQHFADQKYKELEVAKSLFESGLSDQSNELLREHLERFTFSNYYGIHANRDMRITLQNFQKPHENEISWIDLKRAYHFIKPEGDPFKIRLSFFSHFGRWLVTGLSWLVGIYSVVIMFMALWTKINEPLQYISLTALSVMLLFTALVFSSLNWPYHRAVKIRKYIKALPHGLSHSKTQDAEAC